LKWYRNEFAIPEVALSKETGVDPYEYINEQVDKIKPGANGLICIPYLPALPRQTGTRLREERS
jgi:xylulokinase